MTETNNTRIMKIALAITVIVAVIVFVLGMDLLRKGSSLLLTLVKERGQVYY